MAAKAASFRKGSEVKFKIGRGEFVGKIIDLDEQEAEIVAEVQGEKRTYYRLLEKIRRA